MEKPKTIKTSRKSAKGLNNKVLREYDARILSLCVVSLVVGLIAVGGLAFAAQQHFTAIKQSSQNVELRRKRDSLLVEQKRLILQHEIALSPEQLTKNAQQLGLQPMTVNQIETLDKISQSSVSVFSPNETKKSEINVKTSSAKTVEKDKNAILKK